MHVKGHCGNEGNDCADERVQWGKDGGPYRRFRKGGGEGPGRFGPVEKDGEELGGAAAAGETIPPWRALLMREREARPSGRAVEERTCRHRRRRRCRRR